MRTDPDVRRQRVNEKLGLLIGSVKSIEYILLKIMWETEIKNSESACKYFVEDQTPIFVWKIY